MTLKITTFNFDFENNDFIPAIEAQPSQHRAARHQGADEGGEQGEVAGVGRGLLGEYLKYKLEDKRKHGKILKI